MNAYIYHPVHTAFKVPSSQQNKVYIQMKTFRRNTNNKSHKRKR